MKSLCTFRKKGSELKNKEDEGLICVRYSSKESIDVEYNSKIARFFGDIVYKGFRACASSMKWLAPKRDAPVSPEERVEWIALINSHFKSSKNRIFFVDDNGNELFRYSEDVYIEIKHSAKGIVDVKYKGKTARLFGNETRKGFETDINSMTWASPKRMQNIPVSPEERVEWIARINNYYANVKETEFRVYFMNNQKKRKITGLFRII